MKIVCEGCGAKYAIADEKVAGKVFKIRCKKCSEVIVVRGERTQPAARQDEEAMWHVVVDGQQQGPYSAPQISEMLTSGAIDWESYVWREGAADWSPARDDEPLVSAIMGASPSVAAVANQAKTSRRDAGADLFAAHDASSSAYARTEEADEGVAAPPVSHAIAPSTSAMAGADMTGARNESSVLFSLENLRALTTGASSPSAARSNGRGAAVDHASGLIDIRALATAGPSTGRNGAGAGARASIDDLLSIGPSASPFGGPLGAPVLAPSRGQSPNVALYAALGVAGVAVVALAVVLAIVLGGGGGDAVASNGAARPVDTTARETTTAAPPAPDRSAPVLTTTANAPRDPQSSSQTPVRRNHRGTSRNSATAPRTTNPPASPAPVAPPTPNRAPSSIDQLLDNAINPDTTRPAAPQQRAPEASNLPDTPSREQVMTALRGVQGSVQACGGGQHGSAMTAITISGSTGRVTGASVAGQFASTPVAACIERATRGARFPRFRRETFRVTFPFRL